MALKSLYRTPLWGLHFLISWSVVGVIVAVMVVVHDSLEAVVSQIAGLVDLHIAAPALLCL